MSDKLSPQEIFDKQSRRLTESVEDVRKGVNAVQESPMDKAVANLDKASANYAAAIRSGKTAARLRAVSLDDWKRLTVAKADRIPAGVQEAQSKIVDFHGQRQAVQSRISDEIARMPDRTAADQEARMLHQIRRMREFRFIPRN